MNDPKDMPIDVQEMIGWLTAYKRRTMMSWSALAKDCGDISGVTLSAFANGSYQGNLQAVSRKIFQFRQKVESQEDRSFEALARPNYVETPTGQRIQTLLQWAQMGRIIVAAMGPGTGKTMTAEHYKDSVGGTVWLATMDPTTRSPSAMIAELMRAMGITSKSGWTQQRFGQICEYAYGRRGLLIVDEANFCDTAALEQLRCLHDKAGVGIALLGNEELLLRIRGGANRHQYARLNSRIARAHVQDMPIAADVDAYCDAMRIEEREIRRLLTEKALSPGHGGLREVQQILESANIFALTDDQDLGLAHVREAISTRATTQTRRAA